MSELTIENLCCVCCAEDVEAAVGAIPGVRRASVDLERGVLGVEGVADGAEDRIRAAVHGLGYRIAGDGLRPTAAELAHTARLTPITCCTTADRMQYELPHTPVEQEHEPPVAPEHAGMGHDMSAHSVYNVLAIPIAAGVLYPSLGLELQPQWAALLMSVSSIIVATNAVLLKRAERRLPPPSGEAPGAGAESPVRPRTTPQATKRSGSRANSPAQARVQKK